MQSNNTATDVAKQFNVVKSDVKKISDHIRVGGDWNS
jgi:hypothetical protein